MSEEPKKKEEVNEEEEGEVKPEKPKSVLELADEKIARMEALDKSLGEKLDALSELKATDMLSGTSEAGAAPEPKKEMSDEDYKDAVMRGETPDVGKKE